MIETAWTPCKPYTSIHHFYNMNFTCNLVLFDDAMKPGYMASEAANLGQLPGATYRVHLNAGVVFFGYGKTSALGMILRIRGTNKRQWQPLKPCMFESYREEQKKVSRVDSLVPR